MNGTASPELAEAGWAADDTSVAAVADQLGRLSSQLFWQEESRSAARSLTLVVGAADPGFPEDDVERRLATLAAHQPARTILLREHDAPRLDADVRLACSVGPAPGIVGVCHDRVTLVADRPRLIHADSLVRPLLVPGVPVAVWLPDGALGPCDAPLAGLADHLVLDTALGDDARAALRRARAAAAAAQVHDLAWGALEWWRARVAASFAEPARRGLLDRVTAVEVDHASGGEAPALLLAGWIAARAGWPLVDAGHARHRFGSPIALELRRVEDARGHGGVERLALRANGDDALEVRRGATSERGRDVFVEALRPSARFARGYDAALDALGPALD